MKRQIELSSIARKNGGITLIALVITIIVLLILAGVSLSLITGSDGILGRSEKAVDQTNISSGKEQAELLVADYLSEYYEEAYINANQEVARKTAEAYIQGKITADGMATSAGDYFVTIGSDKAITVYKGSVADENNKVAEGTLSSGGKVEWNDETTGGSSGEGSGEGTGGSGETDTTESLSTQITTDNYGDYVNLGTNYVKGNTLETGTATEDWRIFYKDETGGTYLILADYLPYSYETTIGSGLINADSSYPYNWKSGTSRSDLLTRLSDTSAWNNLIDRTYTDKGISVTGALDLETWVASWNEKGYTKLYTAQKNDSIGYYVGTSENPTSYNQSVTSDTAGYGNSLYFPHKDYTTRKNVYAYWLASPSLYSGNYVMNVNYNGSVNRGEYSDNGYGARPAVYLPSDIQAKKVGEVWELDI